MHPWKRENRSCIVIPSSRDRNKLYVLLCIGKPITSLVVAAAVLAVLSIGAQQQHYTSSSR